MKSHVDISLNLKHLLLIILAIASLQPFACMAEDAQATLLKSDPQKLARGIGHFERSRSMLLAAIREFDSGYKYVKTDQVLDAQKWRKTLLDRAEELETILSPEPREIKAGSRYEPDSRILGAKIKPKAKLEKDQAVKPDAQNHPEAKVGEPQIDPKERLELDLSGS